MEEILRQLAASLSHGVAEVSGMPAGTLRIRMPARDALASCPLVSVADAGIAAARLSADSFPPVLGVPPVSGVEAKNGWLLFTLSDDFYTALIRYIQRVLPRPASDGGSHTVNRMLCMARASGDSCPADERVQRALFLALCGGGSQAALRRAKTALAGMTHHVPPRERATLAAACGGVADAAARLLVYFSNKKSSHSGEGLI